MSKRVNLGITIDQQLHVMDCASCGIVFGVPDEFDDRRRADGKSFYCPSGHSNVYGNNENARLKKRIEFLEREEQWERDARIRAEQRAETLGHSLRATKGVVTKLKKRAANGVCPCCNRHFANLHRHMQSQHPDFAVEVEE